MREIRFRGEKINTGEIVTGFYHQDPEDGHFIIDFEYVHVPASFDEPPEGYFKKVSNQVIPESIGQFTGLQDKNGKPIFEGDLLNFGGKTNVPVVFENGCFTVFNEPLGWYFDNFDDGLRVPIHYDTTKY